MLVSTVKMVKKDLQVIKDQTGKPIRTRIERGRLHVGALENRAIRKEHYKKGSTAKDLFRLKIVECAGKVYLRFTIALYL